MEHKTDPISAVSSIAEWVANAIAERESMAAETSDKIRQKEEARAERLRNRAHEEANALTEKAEKLNEQITVEMPVKEIPRGVLTPPATPVTNSTPL